MVSNLNFAASYIRQEAGNTNLCLAVTPGEPERQTQFLDARALQPDVTARGLRTVSEIVAARFYVPPSMLARILREADPVATVGPQTLRFEGLSACCSTYARLDIDDTALKIAHRRKGTTNVDFGTEMRAELARIRSDTKMSVTVGADAVAISTGNASPVIEEKVPLPTRWIKGFGEVQRVMAGMSLALRLDRISAQRLLRQFPRSGATQKVWINPTEQSARISAREGPNAIPLNGPHRLRALELLLPHAVSLHVYVNKQTHASAWLLECGDQRLTLVVNGDPWRGFSGDGGLLSQIAASNQKAVVALRAQLDWQSSIDPEQMAMAAQLQPKLVDPALGQLAASGLLGYDLKQHAYFHRVLPFDLEKMEQMNPRLKSAQALVAVKAVTILDDWAEVVSGGATQRVSTGGDGWRCTCPWFSKNGILRGPCKHILAVEIQSEQIT